MNNHISFLLDYCKDKPELYNAISTKLWIQFGIRSAELVLLCTFITNEMMKGINYGDKGKNQGNGNRTKKDLHPGRSVKNDGGQQVEHCKF